MFNTVFFHKQMKPHVKSLQDYEPFFYPLDKVLHWNRMYGKRGLVQFQYAIPWAGAKEGTIAILREVAKSGLASFLAVLKAFGDIPSLGMMSFPQAGHHVRARLSHQARHHLPAAAAPGRHDAWTMAAGCIPPRMQP